MTDANQNSSTVLLHTSEMELLPNPPLLDSDKAIIYANANSLLDHTNGAARSIRLLLEELAKAQHPVFAVMGCTSDSQEGFGTSKHLWLKHSDRRYGDGPIRRFKIRGVNYSLIATEHWARKYLAADEQEAIYRESERIMKHNSGDGKAAALLSWGNLLLEEALYTRATELGIKTCFYLANPSYKGKDCRPLKNAHIAITDSTATKKLFTEELGKKILVLPKCIEAPSVLPSAERRHEKQIVTFVNPSIDKGLEPFLLIASYLNKNAPNLRLHAIDAVKRLDRDLAALGVERTQLPQNIHVCNGANNPDDLLKETTIALLPSIWHESGSRLIHECHLRGIPILAFQTGGNIEMLSGNPKDIFPLPHISDDKNKPRRIRFWNPLEICNRIIELSESREKYTAYSRLLEAQSKKLRHNCSEAVSLLLPRLFESPHSSYIGDSSVLP